MIFTKFFERFMLMNFKKLWIKKFKMLNLYIISFKHNKFGKNLLLLLKMCKFDFIFSIMLNNSYNYTYNLLYCKLGHYAMDLNHYGIYIIHS
jgi:hypothetical protein